MVSHRWLLQAREPGIKASHLSCAARAIVHGKGIVKVHGVFPSSCGQPASSPALQVRRVSRQDSRTFVTPFVQVGTYPTRNFAQLCCFTPQRSCRGFERHVNRFQHRRGVDISATLCMSPCSSDYIFSNKLCVGIWHIVSEDSSETEAKPQGLKPRQFCRLCGTTEVVPFHKPRALRARSASFPLAFPADYLHPTHCHVVLQLAWDTQTFQHIARFY